MNTLINKIVRTLTAVILSAALFLAQAPIADAARIASISDLDKPRVSFTFDDGFASTRTLAAPILEERGIDGVLYLTSGVPDGTFTLDDNQPGITWDQVRELQNVYGWEIGGHTVDHPEMPTITAAQNEAELVSSNTAFQANGLNVTNFASPFGAYDNVTVTEILKYYKSHRGFADRDALNAHPYNKSVLMVQDVNDTTTPAQVQAWVDQAITEKRWLVLVFHDTATQVNPNYEYTVTTANLTTMANYVQTKVAAGQIEVVTMEQGITIPGTNIIQNSGFENGLANGWTTDNANGVKADNGNHGNYGSPTQSVSLTGTATASHLFYNNAQVSYNSSYVIDAFVNALGLTSGELGFYVDEYDVNGNYISGQWMGMVTNGTIGFFTKLYNATSELVNTIRVQVYLTAGATGTAYVDSVNVYNLDGTPAPTPTSTPSVTPMVTPTGTPSVTPIPSPAGTNVLVNGSFDNGSVTGWSSDSPENVVVATDGSNYFAMFTGNAQAVHLFSDLIAADPLTSYVIRFVADTTALNSGELGFYIDEYDVNGNYLSGQWIGAAAQNVSALYEHIYQASSNLVSSFSIQTYLTAGATGYALTDDYAVYDPNVNPSPTPVAGNIVTNGSFDNGLASWNTTDTTNVVAANGAVTMTGNAAQMYLYQHIYNFDSAGVYRVQATLDTTGLTSGNLGFYVDEYDAAGNWLSVQFWGFTSGALTNFDRIYTASTNLVDSIRVHAFLTPGTTGTAKVDSISITNQGSAAVTPTVTPTVAPTGTPSVTPTPAPTGSNILANGSFDNGLTSWNTTDTTNVVAQNGNVTLTGTAAQIYLYQHVANFDNTGVYRVLATLDTTGLTSGELGFYVDEYDAAGNWLSVQFWGFTRGTVTNFDRIYTASTNLVNSIRVHAFLTPGTTGTAKIDGISITNENGVSVTPSPTVTPTVTPTVEPTVTPTVTPSVSPTPTTTPANNLVTNGGFETVSSDFAANWTRDTSDFFIDTTSKGNNGTNSLHIAANTLYAHAFSDMITIDSATTYTWSQFVSVLTGTGELGFYIDEYDVNGNYLSGQWKGMVTGPTTGVQSFQYVPTSTAVHTVRLQYYVTPNSTFNLYIDSLNLSN